MVPFEKVLEENYQPSLFLRNGHFNTIFTTLYKKDPDINYQRVTISTHDEDRLDLDEMSGQHKKLAILCHGLEGSSRSKYIQRTALILSEKGWDISAVNYRGCSGRNNLKPQLYHSGWTPDIDTIVRHYTDRYEKIALIGFSLGGNLIMKYIGDGIYSLPENLIAGIAISAPVDLYSSSFALIRKENILYTNRFLKSLHQKLVEKNQQFPEIFDLTLFSDINNLRDFDDVYTGPLNGFDGADDYYKKCSAGQFLEEVKIPALILNAKDDPFLSETCLPDIQNPKITTLYPSYGGHVGFYKSGEYCWSEKVIASFLSHVTKLERS